MSALGKLVASVILDTAEFTVGTDKVKFLAANAASSIDRSFRDMENKVKGAMGGIAAALSAGTFVALIKGAIEAQASMKDLGIAAGISAEAMSSFETPARMAGLTLEDVSKAIFKMSKAALEAKTPMSDAAQALKAIGISTAELKGLTPDQMFERVARSLGGFADGLEKNAVSMTLFGKSGREMNRLIAEMAEGGKLNATVTAEQAEAAKKLEDETVRLKMESEKFWRSLATEAVPALNDVLKAFNDGKASAGLYAGAVAGLSAAFDQIKGTGPVAELARIDERIKEVTESTKTLQEQPWWAMFGQGSLQGESAQLDGLKKQRDALRAEIHALELAAQDKRAIEGMKGKPGLNFDPDAARKRAEEEKKYLELSNKGWVAYIEAITKEYEEGLQADGKVLDAWLANEKKMLELGDAGWVKHIEAVTEEYEQGLKEMGAMSKSWTEQQDEITKQQREQQMSFYDDIAGRAGNFFADLVMNGKSAFDRLKQSLKSFAAEIIAFFAKKWVLQMIAGVAGGGATGANASTGGGMFGPSAFGDGFSVTENAWGTGAGGFSSAMGGAAIGGVIGGVGAMAFGNERNSSSMTMGGTIGGAIGSIWGPIGAIIGSAIGTAIGSLISSGGGPKGGGSFYGNYSASGAYQGQGNVPGSDNGRFYTPRDQDSAVMAIGQATATSFYAMARTLGIKPGGFTFGLGFDSDPNGTAGNRISSQVRDASGNLIFGSQDRSIGRDDANIKPELQLEASRMLLAALKASDLPEYLAKVFDGLTVSTATQQEIDDALTMAGALKEIFDVISSNPMEDVAKAIADSQNQFQSSLRNNATAIRAVIDAYDKSAASTKNLATATSQYYNAQLQLLAGITQISQQIEDMFNATFQNILLAGMDKQGKYNFYQQDAEQARALIATATDPETIRALATRINTDINNAFGLLSPDEQGRNSAAFIEQGRQAQREAQERLAAIQSDAAKEMQRILNEIKGLLGLDAETNKQTAEKNLEAANLQVSAAHTPLTLDINLTNGAAVVNGG